MSQTDVIEIFTAKSPNWIFKEGGSAAWVLDRAHAKRCQYAVLYRNASTDWGDGKEPHGTAFMVGRVADVVPARNREDRWVIQFDAYALVDLADAWPGYRNPIHYATVADISKKGLDLDALTFTPMPPAGPDGVDASSPSPSPLPPTLITIADAKLALAKTFGVKPEAIEITIRG